MRADRRTLDLVEVFSEATGRGVGEWIDHASFSRFQRATAKTRAPRAPGELECEQCRARFVRSGHLLRFCSWACVGAARRRRNRRERTCPVCWRDFMPKTLVFSTAKRNGRRATCSARCRQAFIVAQLKARSVPKLTCPRGHAKVYSSRSRRWYCRDCHAVWSRALNQRLTAARHARGLRHVPAYCRGGVRRLTTVEIEMFGVLSDQWVTPAVLRAALGNAIKSDALSARLARLLARGLVEHRPGRSHGFEWRRTRAQIATGAA